MLARPSVGADMTFAITIVFLLGAGVVLFARGLFGAEPQYTQLTLDSNTATVAFVPVVPTFQAF